MFLALLQPVGYFFFPAATRGDFQGFYIVTARFFFFFLSCYHANTVTELHCSKLQPSSHLGSCLFL